MLINNKNDDDDNNIYNNAELSEALESATTHQLVITKSSLRLIRHQFSCALQPANVNAVFLRENKHTSDTHWIVSMQNSNSSTH